MNADHRVLQAERERAAALVARDVAALRQLLDPELRYTHSTGTHHDLDGYLRFVETGPRFEQVALDPLQVVDLGDGVAITGRLLMRLQRAGEPLVESRSWVTALWLHTTQGWRLRLFQSTKEASS